MLRLLRGGFFSGRSRWRREFGEFLAGIVPYPQDAIKSPGKNCLTVGGGSDGIHVFASAGEVALIVAIGGVDEADLGIAAASDDEFICHESHAGDFFGEQVLDGAK